MIKSPLSLYQKIAVVFLLIFFVVNIRNLPSFAFHNAGVLLQNAALVQETALQKEQQLSRSIALFNAALNINGGNQRARRSLGYAYLELGETEQAFHAWQNAPLMEEELLRLAAIAERNGNYNKALFWYDKVVALVPDWSEGWYALGLFYQTQSATSEAIEPYMIAIETAESDSCELSASYYRLGEIYQIERVDGNWDEAVEMYETAVFHNTFCDNRLQAQAHYRLGELYTQQGEGVEIAIAQFEKAVAANPNHHWARLRWGVAIYQTQRDLELAVEQIKVSIAAWEKSRSPNLKWAYRYLGDIYFQDGSIEDALTAYEKVVLLDEENSYAIERIKAITSETNP